jgi:Concanavalin A-like lectin/glucanases superfamily
MPVRDILNAASGAASYGPSDPYFYDVSLLLNGDGTNGAQNNTFLDSSSNAFTITRNGNTTQGSFSPYGNLWSNYFSSNSGLTAPNNSAFKPATNDFTVECWIFPTSSGSEVAIYGDSDSGTNNGTFDFNINSSGYLKSDYWTSSTAITTRTSTLAPTLNQWNHVVLSRSGTTMYIGLNGVLQSFTAPSSYQSPSTTYPTVGRLGAYSSGLSFTGYISNFRYLNGTMLYSGTTYTVPTAPLTTITNTVLLTTQSNRFIDNSSNAFTLTVNGSPSVQRFSPFNPTAPYSTTTIGGSGYFGSGNSLSTTSQIAPVGTQNFTVEWWSYLTGGVISGGEETYLDTNGVSNGVVFGTDGTNVYCAINGVGVVVSYAFYQQNSWNHYAVTRSGNNFTLYINGTSVATATNSISFASASTYTISGRISSSNKYVNGYISDLRTTLNSVLYTGNFTPPTAPLTSSGSTTALLSFQNAGISDLAMQNDWITNGGTQVSTGTKKFGTGSLYINSGSLQCFPYNESSLSKFAGDFTWEYWFYPTNSSSSDQGGGLSYRDGGFSSGCFQTKYDGTSGTINFIFDGGGTTISGNGISTNTWNYIALVRSSGTLSLYVNGTRKNTASYSTVIIGGAGSTLGFFIGDSYDGNHYYVIGYMDDVRITNGYARYSGTTMTVPTAALPTY